MKKILKKIKLFGFSALIILASFFGVQSCGVNVAAPKIATVSASAESVTPTQVSDLTDTTWEIDAYPDLLGGQPRYLINFTANNENFVGIMLGQVDDIDPRWLTYLYNLSGIASDLHAYNSYGATPGWLNESYRTITITGGADATNATLIAWLENNATLISGGGGDGGNPDIPEGVYYWAPDNPFADFDGELPQTFAYTYDIQTAYNGNIYDSITLGRTEQGYYIYANREGFTLRVFQLGVWNAAFDDWRDEMVVTEDYYFTPTAESPQIGFDIIFSAIITPFDEPQTPSERYWYRVGYDFGYDEGYDFGYDEGYRNGYRYGQATAGSIGQSIWDNMFIFISNFFDALIELLSVELVPSVNIGLVTIGIPMVIWAVGAIIRLVLFFFGGA